MTKVDSQVEKLLKEWAKAPKLAESVLTPLSVREADKSVQKLQEPVEEVGSVKKVIASTSEGEIPIKVYYSRNYQDTEKQPTFIYFHGGGFVINGDSYESPIRRIANLANVVICSVQYSLAPENKFPKAVNEAIESVKWIANNLDLFNGDKEKIVLGGDSSGGNLATVVALENQTNKILDLKHLILIYPMLDATCSQPSIIEFEKGYGFTKEKIEWYLNQYLPKDIDRTNPYISPLFAKNLKGFPSTFIATAEFDPIRDEGELFAKRLEESGVNVHLKRYKGMIHGFYQMAGVLNQGKQFIEDVANELKKI